MSTTLFWFRNDLRLHDQPALHAALQAAGSTPTQHLLPVYCLPDLDASTAWGFTRVGSHRRAWLRGALRDLGEQLHRRGCPLLVCAGPAAISLPALARRVGAQRLVCEEIAAPEEQAEVSALREAGLEVHTVWQSSLLDPSALPWPPHALPASFTPFRQALERARIRPPAPLPPPSRLPSWPALEGLPPGLSATLAHERDALVPGASPDWGTDARTSLPRHGNVPDGGERAGLAHLEQYLARHLPERYKRTRNALAGVDHSSKWSPWMATGALSVRLVHARLRDYEAQHGASEGSYWLWFELLWRDYFRLLHLQHGRRLYGARGLAPGRANGHHAEGFARWRTARTGEPLVDAGMRELAATGFLSNRMRLVVASHLIHALGGDWRAGAAWFEAQLVDYDVYSNQGNWLYIAGRGTDPRGGRRFNVEKQAAEHDPEGHYRARWGTP